MRVIYIIPGPMSRTALGSAEVERRGSRLQSWAAPGTSVDIRDVERGPASIESAYEEYLSIPSAAEAMLEAEEQGCDAGENGRGRPPPHRGQWSGLPGAGMHEHVLPGRHPAARGPARSSRGEPGQGRAETGRSTGRRRPPPQQARLSAASEDGRRKRAAGFRPLHLLNTSSPA